MKTADEITRIIGESKPAAAPVTAGSDLFIDLGYDSLGFVCLLLEIERELGIQFELTETGECVRVDRLIALAKQKVRESAHD